MKIFSERTLNHYKRHWMLYAMLVPGIIWLILFRFIPISGSIIAFKDYQIFRGVFASPWVGFKHFERLFQYDAFYRVLKNTLLLALYNTIFFFPVPILLAIAINEVPNILIKRSIQTVLYIPHFLSWVIVAGLFMQILGQRGIVNLALTALGYKPILFVQKEAFFRPIVVLAGIWRDMGWGTIIYLAAISGINPALYEAAMVDGASRWQQIRHITFPTILPTALVLLLLRVGRFMNLGFDRVYNFLTPLTFSVGDIFDTFVFRVGVIGGQYSFTTAIGLFQSLVGLLMIIGFNKLSKKVTGGLW